jgi:predicted HAD superfamily Cof-like phosphohydrolase
MMMASETNFGKVKTFMETFGQEVLDKPQFPDVDVVALRYELIKEELEELFEAMGEKDLVEVADALTDILYVTYGAGHAFGIDLDACFDEVQRSNMSKLGADGKPMYREDGKILKGPNYSEPDLTKFVS